MSGEKYPAKLVEKVARAIVSEAHWSDGSEAYSDCPECHAAAVAALDATPYAAMREALEQALIYLRLDCEWDTVALVESALRAADGE